MPALLSDVIFLLAAISCSSHLLPQACQVVVAKKVCFGSAALDLNRDLQLQHQHKRQELPPPKTASQVRGASLSRSASEARKLHPRNDTSECFSL